MITSISAYEIGRRAGHSDHRDEAHVALREAPVLYVDVDDCTGRFIDRASCAGENRRQDVGEAPFRLLAIRAA
jgi:hypothetical protein